MIYVKHPQRFMGIFWARDKFSMASWARDHPGSHFWVLVEATESPNFILVVPGEGMTAVLHFSRSVQHLGFHHPQASSVTVLTQKDPISTPIIHHEQLQVTISYLCFSIAWSGPCLDFLGG